MSNLIEEISRRRTFAIISHPDAGKTTLTEKFLLYGGAIAQAGVVKGKKALVGSLAFMTSQLEVPSEVMHQCDGFSEEGKTPILVASDAEVIGLIAVADVVREDSVFAISKLKAMGIHTVMLTGDVNSVGEKIAADIGIDTVVTELLPHQKVEHFEKILEQNANGKVCYVGDGINDAPVLARADIGIAMGALGSDAAIEAADVVIMNDEIGKITTAIKVAQKTLAIVKQNIVFAIGVKLIVLALVAVGFATDEMKNVYKKSICFNVIAGIVMCVLGIALSGFLARLFVGYDSALCEMTQWGFIIY